MKTRIKYYPVESAKGFVNAVKVRMNSNWVYPIEDLPYSPKEGVWNIIKHDSDCIGTSKTYLCKEGKFYLVATFQYNYEAYKRLNKYKRIEGVPDEFLTKEARAGRNEWLKVKKERFFSVITDNKDSFITDMIPHNMSVDFINARERLDINRRVRRILTMKLK